MDLVLLKKSEVTRQFDSTSMNWQVPIFVPTLLQIRNSFIHVTDLSAAEQVLSTKCYDGSIAGIQSEYGVLISVPKFKQASFQVYTLQLMYYNTS